MKKSQRLALLAILAASMTTGSANGSTLKVNEQVGLIRDYVNNNSISKTHFILNEVKSLDDNEQLWRKTWNKTNSFSDTFSDGEQ